MNMKNSCRFSFIAFFIHTSACNFFLIHLRKNFFCVDMIYHLSIYNDTAWLGDARWNAKLHFWVLTDSTPLHRILATSAKTGFI